MKFQFFTQFSALSFAIAFGILSPSANARTRNVELICDRTMFPEGHEVALDVMLKIGERCRSDLEAYRDEIHTYNRTVDAALSDSDAVAFSVEEDQLLGKGLDVLARVIAVELILEVRLKQPGLPPSQRLKLSPEFLLDSPLKGEPLRFAFSIVFQQHAEHLTRMIGDAKTSP